MARSKNTSGSKKGGRKSASSGIKGQSKKATTKVNTTAASGTFPKALLKAANERLRKLEKVTGYAKGNVLYQNMKNKMMNKPKKEGIIFKSDKTGRGVRFISEREFNKLTPEQQAYYMARLEGFMKSAWSKSGKKGGVQEIRKKISEKLKPQEEARERAFDTFRNRPEIRDKFPDLTYEQYKALYEAYQRLRDVKGDHFKYDDLNMFLEYVRLDQLKPDQIEEAMSFVKDDDWGELADRGWLQRF